MRPNKSLLIVAIILFTIISNSFAQEASKINSENIKSAETLIDLEFTPSERDSMQDALQEQLTNYKNIHKFELNNNVTPAVLFNPIPVGFTAPVKEEKLAVSDYSGTKLSADKEELAYYSIGQLAELIKTKQITSVELTKFYIERLKKYGPVLQSVITITEELALKQAAQADKEIAAGSYKGLLHGIPFGVKDLLAVKGYKTTWGSVPYKDQVIDEDATVVKKLTDAGGVLAAKLTMGELAWGDVWFGGMTRNPWDTSQGSSGSSAGSASSVSAGLLPYAIGTETWGSIVSPSTVCGVTGLRPTYGRVSRTGAMTLSWSMDKIGAICRNAEDCAIVFKYLHGPDGIDQTLYDFPFNYESQIDFKKLKIGYLKKDFDKQYGFKKNDSLFIETLKKLGAELVPIELPAMPINDLAIILNAEAGAAFDELTRSGKDDMLVRQIKNAWPNVFRTSRFIPAVEYINANRIRTLLIQEMYNTFKTIDFYIAPSWEGDNLLLTNLTGHPCVVIPTGLSVKGTPTSITLIGNLFDEGKIIAAAHAFQQVTDFHLTRPESFKKKGN
jgi:Asp-tRNA(Asn)/Glu-tRNA(Gln) amidotransferase A subunit family amidase